jgi:putative LysE/RhtB family amino acid efflux pump
MFEAHPILLAAIAGFACALIFASIPVGPINLTILNEGAQRGFRWAILIGLGASTMDTIYCAISFTGLSSFLDHGIIKASMQVASFVFLLFLGCKFLFAQSVKVPTKLDSASHLIEARLEQKLHPHSAFMIGVIRVAGNLGVLGAWLVLSAALMSSKAFFTEQDWVEDTIHAKTACVIGVFSGTVAWFFFLSFAVSRGHGRFSEKTLLRLQHFSGLCLIAAALFQGGHIAWQMTNHGGHHLRHQHQPAPPPEEN